MRITLDAPQIQKACEEFVGKRIDQATERAVAQVSDQTTIMVLVSKRRIRKPKVQP